MPRKKSYEPPVVPAGVRRTAGFLTCEACRRVVPYFGYKNPDHEPWPQHRCTGREIRGFDHFDTEEPFPSPSMSRR